MVAEARLWSRLVAVVAVIVAVSFLQIIRWQADLGPTGSAKQKPEVRPYVVSIQGGFSSALGPAGYDP